MMGIEVNKLKVKDINNMEEYFDG
jgi:hypothetical protein